MSLKKLIKNTMGFIRCRKAGVHTSGGYVGRNVHFDNGGNIFLGKNVQIRPDVDLFAGSKIVIGDNCDIGTRNRITGNVTMEDSVLLGPNNYLSSVDHVYQNINIPVINQGVKVVSKDGHEELFIGSGSWIGTHTAIIGCVHIGKHCVIGANTVITRDVPDYCVVVGNPARIVKHYNVTQKKWERVDGSLQ